MPSPSGCAMPTASAPPARLLLRSRRPAHDHAGPLHAPLACRHSLPRGLPACLPPPARAPRPGAAPSRPSMAARATMRAGPKAGKRAGASASAGSAGRRRQEHRRVCRRRHSRQPRQPGAARRARKAPDAGQPCPPTSLTQLKQRLKAGLPGPLPRCGKPVRLRGVRPSLVFGCALPARRTGLASGIARTQCRSQDRAAVE